MLSKLFFHVSCALGICRCTLAGLQSPAQGGWSGHIWKSLGRARVQTPPASAAFQGSWLLPREGLAGSWSPASPKPEGFPLDQFGHMEKATMIFKSEKGNGEKRGSKGENVLQLREAWLKTKKQNVLGVNPVHELTGE